MGLPPLLDSNSFSSHRQTARQLVFTYIGYYRVVIHEYFSVSVRQTERLLDSSHTSNNQQPLSSGRCQYTLFRPALDGILHELSLPPRPHMVAQPGASGLFQGTHSYFDSPERRDSPKSKRARISIEDLSPVSTVPSVWSRGRRKSEVGTTSTFVLGEETRSPYASRVQVCSKIQNCMHFCQACAQIQNSYLI